MVARNFEQRLDALARRVDDLHRTLPASVETPLAVLVEEFEASLEELRVAQEEIPHQNEELIEAQHALEAERVRYQDLFEFAPDAYLLTDAAGMTEEANQAAVELFTVSTRYLTTRPLAVFVDVPHRTRFRNFLEDVKRSAASSELYATMRTPQEKVFEAALRAAPVRNVDGRVTHVRWLVRDVSEQAEREHVLSALNDELERRVRERTSELEVALGRLQTALQAKDEFLGLVSHELKTPITTIYGNAQVLRNRGGKLSEDDRDASLSDIEEEASRLHRVVENLLIVSQVEAGRATETEPVLLQRVVHEVIHRRGRLTQRRGVQVMQDGLLPPAAAEPIYVEQLLENLLGNADKYSPPGQPIEVRLAQEDDSIVVRVLDRGRGIDPVEADRLFDAFYRSPRTAGEVTGTGIGLSVCKRLVEAQHGRIWAVPRVGGGTEFGFALPVEHAEE